MKVIISSSVLYMQFAITVYALNLKKYDLWMEILFCVAVGFHEEQELTLHHTVVKHPAVAFGPRVPVFCTKPS